MALTKQKIILDVDTGPDDALAILLAIKSKRVDIKGITTVAGNTNLKQVTINTFKILNLAKRLDIPVFQGNSKPLAGKGKRGKTSGKDGLCEIEIPSPKKKAKRLPAEEFIKESILAYPKKIAIIATAPLTNIAKVLKKNPKIKEKIKKIFIMGGVIKAPGNVTPFAEFNFFNDPEAVKIVFKSGVPITLIPLDVTLKILIARDWLLRKYGKSEDSITKFIVNLVNNRYRLMKKDWFYLHDPLALILAINRNFGEFKKERLNIIKRGEEKGRIIKDIQGQEIELVYKVKKGEILNYFKKLLLKK